MDKKIIILFVILLLVVGGVFFLFSGNESVIPSFWRASTPVSTLTYEESQAERQKSTEQNLSLYTTAIREQNQTLCQSIQDAPKKEECLSMVTAALAQKSDTIEQCDTITLTGVLTLCRDNISAARAEQKKDKTFCESISHPDTQAYCKESIDTIRYQEATASGALTQEFCTSLEPDIAKKCTQSLAHVDDTKSYQTAVATRDIADCEGIQDTTLKTNCQDIAYLSRALTQGDVSLCDSIQGQDRKSVCTKQLEKKSETVRFSTLVTEGDIEACATLTDTNLQSQCHDLILIHRVQASHDITLCDSLISTGMLASCQKVAGGAR